MQQKKLFAEERKERIIEMLNAQQKIVIPDLCRYFNISPATIRNDLNELQESGLLKRTHGGAILNKQVSDENAFIQEVEHLKEKRAIGLAALQLINDGDTIVLDTGTTTMELAKLLSQKKRLTIVINDIQIAALMEAQTDASIVFVGGYLRKGLHCTVGPMANRELRELKVDKAFIATNGLTLEGLSTPDMYQADTKQSMLRIANYVVVLADSSKLGASSFQQFCKLKEFDHLITDSHADDDELNKFRERDIEVTVAPV